MKLKQLPKRRDNLLAMSFGPIGLPENNWSITKTIRAKHRSGRNDICPHCESGKKYKKCCGKDKK